MIKVPITAFAWFIALTINSNIESQIPDNEDDILKVAIEVCSKYYFNDEEQLDELYRQYLEGEFAIAHCPAEKYRLKCRDYSSCYKCYSANIENYYLLNRDKFNFSFWKI